MDSQDKPIDVPGSSTNKGSITMDDESETSTATATTTISSSTGITPCSTIASVGDDTAADDHNLAPFNPSGDLSQCLALELLNLQDDDVLFDLGCGDGRILIRAVQTTTTTTRTNCRCVGIEIDNVFATRAQLAIRQQLSIEEQRRIEIRRQDLLETQGATSSAAARSPAVVDDNDKNSNYENEEHDVLGADCRELSLLEDATALYLYLLPRGLKKLRPLLEKIVARRKEQGKPFRVVAYTFQLVGWDPVIVNRSTKSGVPIYLYQFDP